MIIKKFDSVVNMLNAMEIINGFSPEELDSIANNLSEDEIDNALDAMNQLKMKKIGDIMYMIDMYSLKKSGVLPEITKEEIFDKILDFFNRTCKKEQLRDIKLVSLGI